METKQNVFTFHDVGWMLNGYDESTVPNLTRGLRYLGQFGIRWALVTDDQGTRLNITGYDLVLTTCKQEDDVTFLVHHVFEDKEDEVIVFTIDTSMVVTVRKMDHYGDLKEIKY